MKTPKNIFVLQKIPVSKKYAHLDKPIRGVKNIEKILKANKKLNKAVGTIFNKKTFAVAAVSTTIGLAAFHVDNYIKSNSGCFLKKSNGSVCKVRELSCCQPDIAANINYCTPRILLAGGGDPCKDYDEDKEASCCRLCSCNIYGCSPNDSMECRRPTVGEALSYFAQGISEGISSVWSKLFSFLPYLMGCMGIVALLVVIVLVYKSKTR